MSMFIVVGWSVWWLLWGLCFFSFYFGNIVTNRLVSHNILWQSLVEDVGESWPYGGFYFVWTSPTTTRVWCVGWRQCMFIVIKYVYIRSLDLDSGLSCMNVFVWLHTLIFRVKYGASMGAWWIAGLWIGKIWCTNHRQLTCFYCRRLCVNLWE